MITFGPIPSPEASLTPDRASALLRLGLDQPRRPIDEVLDRLAAADGYAWFAEAVEAGPVGTAGAPRDIVIDGRATIDELTRIKEESKRLLHDAGTRGRAERASALIGYFLAIAAALVHHDRQIGGHGRDELGSILEELASASPEPYAPILSRAVARLRAADP